MEKSRHTDTRKKKQRKNIHNDTLAVDARTTSPILQAVPRGRPQTPVIGSPMLSKFPLPPSHWETYEQRMSEAEASDAAPRAHLT